MCNHPSFRDLGNFWQCEKCNRTVKKQTYQECLNKLEAMEVRLNEIASHPEMTQEAVEVMKRIDAIYDKIELELTVKRG